jgi:hypothetical protein
MSNLSTSFNISSGLLNGASSLAFRFLKNTIQLFQKKSYKPHWNKEKELCYFSIVDIITVLTESKNPPAYWRK